MDIKILKKAYADSKSEIKARLREFRLANKENYKNELFFCILTPQSNAKKCWEAIIQLNKLKQFNEENIKNILKARTRFHNNKAKYLAAAQKNWESIISVLESEEKTDAKKLRNWLADNISGYGMKEASHFVRNIGKSNSEIAILDRHILRNLKALKIIKEERIKNRKDYLEKEQKFINFSKKAGIPADELDLLFWSNETGEIFK